jgi:hypothetical protein
MSRNDATLPRMQRRTLLKVGVVTGMRGAQLTLAGREFFASVACAVLAGLSGANEATQAAAPQAHLTPTDATIVGFPPSLQSELTELSSLLATLPGRLALTGLRREWRDASTSELEAMLQRLRDSSRVLRQQVFHAVRDLTNAAYFAHAATWQAIGCPGPLPMPAVSKAWSPRCSILFLQAGPAAGRSGGMRRCRRHHGRAAHDSGARCGVDRRRPDRVKHRLPPDRSRGRPAL